MYTNKLNCTYDNANTHLTTLILVSETEKLYHQKGEVPKDKLRLLIYVCMYEVVLIKFVT
jgi:hypothetical protein